MKLKYIFLIVLIFIAAIFIKDANALEKDYQIPWCKSKNGIWKGYQVTIRDRYTNKVEGFIDCLTATHAIEVDFDYKWKEAPTQARWYAMNSGKRAGILLIITYNKKGIQNSGYKKLAELIYNNNLPIDLFTIDSRGK